MNYVQKRLSNPFTATHEIYDLEAPLSCLYLPSV